MAEATTKTTPKTNKAEAKERFSAAVEEAKAGAAALKAEAGVKAKGKSESLKADAMKYGDDAKAKAGELAAQGKTKTSEAMVSLSKVVSENAAIIDEKVGEKYGDYARSASRSLSETAAKLDAKSVEELGEDAREMVRKSPGLAVGIAAVGGFLLARLFSGGRD